jgi:hypothetical protein
MSPGRTIRCYDYVNHRYEQVRDAMEKRPLEVFQAATKAASSRASAVAAELHVDVGGLGVKSDIAIAVRGIEEGTGARSMPTTTLHLEWEATTLPRLFPLMHAELSLYPLTATETQLDFRGTYEPPLGALGKALDTVAGHRIAEASVHRFVNDVAAYLRTALG